MPTAHTRLIAGACLVFVTSLSGCSSHTFFAANKLEPFHFGDILRLHTFAGIFLSSQPKPDDFRQAQKAGIKTIVSLRLPGEVADFDEPALITELGMTYYNVGFDDFATLDEEVLDRARALLNRHNEKPILIHSASANRVGAIWLAYRAIDHHVPYDQALAEAKEVGLRSPAYEQVVRRYVQQQL